MVKLRPIDVTFITTNAFYERVKIELTRHFEADEEGYSQHVRYKGHLWHSHPLTKSFMQDHIYRGCSVLER